MKSRSTLRLVLAAALLPLISWTGSAHADEPGVHVSGILTTDTTWTAAEGPYYVDGVVQIASGVTLHVAPGTRVVLAYNPNNYAPIFQVAGTLDVEGSSEEPVSLVGQGYAGLAGPVSSATHAVLTLKHVNVSRFASVFPPTGGSGHADYELADSVVTGTTYMSYFWYPVNYARVERNVFVNAASMTFGTTNAVATVASNRFRGYSTSSSYRHYLESWAAYQQPLQVHGNSFEPGPNPVMTVRSAGKIDASSNDWGTTSVSAAKARVVDQEDDLNLPSVVTVEPLLAAPTAETPATAPAQPSSVIGIGGDRQATISWTAPTDGGSPITTYRVTVSPGDRTIDLPGDVTSGVVDGLTNGTSYTFTVTATNAVGTSPASSSTAAITPAAVPSAPEHVLAQQGDGFVRVVWSTSESNGAPVTGYTVAASPGGRTMAVPGGTTETTFSDLQLGTAYSFTVSATNSVGTSLPSGTSNEVVAARAPDAPATVTATPGDGSALVTWTASKANGAEVLGYVLTAYPGGRQIQVFGGDASSYLVTGLRNGVTYSFTVAAASMAGTSQAVWSDAVVPAGKPGQVARPAASVAGRSVTLRWAAPVANGSALTQYVVHCSSGRTLRVAATTRKAVFSRLPPGTYRFTVAARNVVGVGSASAPVNARVR
ncbi:hypothetical protein GCM10027600_14000 [Nocardioides ginsengisegetis]